jgi:hypothetical protein
LGIVVIICAVAGGVGYGVFSEKYKKDRKFRKEADRQIASVQGFWEDLWSPVKADTELMDKIHAENMNNMITQNNANAMMRSRGGGPREPDPVDEEGNRLSKDGTTIIEIRNEEGSEGD